MSKRKNSSPGRGRSWLAGALLVVATVLLPTAIVGHWATVQVGNSNQFVSSLAPLSQNPAVQALVVDKLSTAIDEKIHIDQTTQTLVDGLGQALRLPPKAAAALDLLSAPLSSGIQGLIKNTVAKVVASPAFEKAWTATVTLTHEQLIAVLSNKPGSAIDISNDGTVSLSLKPLMAAVKQQLVESKVPFAKAIPEINATITLAKIPELATARLAYQVGVGVGMWLPWIVAALFAGAVFAARKHWRMVMTSGIIIFVMSGIVGAGLAFGKVILSATLNTTIAQVAGIVYDSLIAYVVTVVAGTMAVGLVMVVAGALLGLKSTAQARAWFSRGFSQARASMDNFGLNTAGFGRGLQKYRVLARTILVIAAVALVAFSEPLSAPVVVGYSLLFSGLLVALEILMRPKIVVAKKSSGTKNTVAKKPEAKKPEAQKLAAQKPSAKK